MQGATVLHAQFWKQQADSGSREASRTGACLYPPGDVDQKLLSLLQPSPWLQTQQRSAQVCESGIQEQLQPLPST